MTPLETKQRRFAAQFDELRRLAAYGLRHVRAADREDMIATAVALCWQRFVRACDDEGELPGYELRNVMYFAILKVRSGRKFAATGKATALDAYAGRTASAEPTRRHDVFGLVSDDTPPPIAVAFHLDYAAFANCLSPAKRRILECLAMGTRTMDAARELRMSAARVSQLRFELCLQWEAFMDECV